MLLAGCLLLWPALLWAEEIQLSALPASYTPATTVSDPLLLLSRQHTTPKAVAAFLKQTFTFQRDQDIFGEVERWQSPEEFLARQTGDCEDYALLARDLLVRNGIEAYVFSLFGDEGYAHTVCVFVEDGRYNVINQDKIRYYRAKSLEAVASQMYPAWTFGGIVEREGTRGRLVKEIVNPHPAPSLASLDAFATSSPF